ncbi:MAG: 2-C-methyl-D-erythritol 2,4-cyclodiphosphate synthase [Clostridia bacterium]|nr:2-C-methyl-D-erythritol 2,4-cyclodiphosphate synthase [Clostridia bacterium]
MSAVGILLCAGSSNRMGFDKLNTPLFGKTAIERSMEALLAGGCDSLVFVVSGASEQTVASLSVPVPFSVVPGGKERSDSVRNGLNAASGEVAVIHDAARCFVSPAVVKASIESAEKSGSGVAAIPMTDTVVRLLDGTVETLDRNTLFRMQTPQAFRLSEIRAAYETGGAATDDATLYAKAFGVPNLIPGSENNRKLTTATDWAWAVERLCPSVYGIGFDTHRLVEGRELILGGVKIPFEKGLLGHSDADVLLHAIMDAILGALKLGDIGKLFPDTDERYRGISSRKLLREVNALVQKRGMYVSHIDATVICERPKLAPHREAIERTIAADLMISPDDVSVKATTTEGMNDEGRGLCISAQAIASLAHK